MFNEFRNSQKPAGLDKLSKYKESVPATKTAIDNKKENDKVLISIKDPSRNNS